MPITILFFGALQDITTQPSLELDSVQDTDRLMAQLLERFPGLQGQRFVLAVNKQVVNQNTVLTPGAEIALLPPFSGG